MEPFEFHYLNVPLFIWITQCGLLNIELGDTFMADRLNKEGQPITSTLDHIYMIKSLYLNKKR